MKKSVKVTLFIALALVFAFGMMVIAGCSGGGGGSSSSSSGGTTYSGTLYMAATEGGGHIGIYPVTIDPSNTTSPITVDLATVGRVQVLGTPGSSSALNFHDVRFGVDSNGNKDYNKIYYSAIKSLATDSSTVPIGYVDLTTANKTGAPNQGVNSKIDIDWTGTLGAFTNGADTIAFALGQIAPVEFGHPLASDTPPLSGTRIDYCASGMDKDYYFPMSMSFPSYVDAIPVGNLATAGNYLQNNTTGTTGFVRTYISQLDPSMDLVSGPASTTTLTGNSTDLGPLPLSGLGLPPLAFIHGASWTNPDTGNTLVYMSTNVMSGLTHTQNVAGFIRSYIVNASDLETQGSTTGISAMTPADVLSNASFTVAPSNSDTTADHFLQGTIAYRASFTPDGTKILQSGSDRMLVISVDPTTHAMSLYADTAGNNNDSPSGASAGQATAIASGLGAGTFGGIEVHDAIPTSDGKYAILAVRYYADATHAIKTSGVQLYDINNKQFVGNVTSTCGSEAIGCHAAATDFLNRPTCGVIFHQTN